MPTICADIAIAGILLFVMIVVEIRGCTPMGLSHRLITE
jgi:hypothetical protein